MRVKGQKFHNKCKLPAIKYVKYVTFLFVLTGHPLTISFGLTLTYILDFIKAFR